MKKNFFLSIVIILILIVSNNLSGQTLIVSPSNQYVPSVSGETKFQVISNITWITSDDADWITLNQDRWK